ncbi:hypothetical protein BDN71DRAFT_1433123 [Pleurotus eryngii]|uniref:Uncharacterized protein n=1 Tax=Pleurotus eryngii TaxID=5323 RepID=A0A9P5ZS79_PLEER|nr:hypothetical protein BDN71DRAFT_1433123 [Pleurotus eryngii]
MYRLAFAATKAILSTASEVFTSQTCTHDAVGITTEPVWERTPNFEEYEGMMAASTKISPLHLNCFAFRRNIKTLLECLKHQKQVMGSIAKRLKKYNREDTESTMAALPETV